MSRDLAGYARKGAWSLVAHAVQFVGGVAVSILVVRALSEYEFGILSEVRQLTALATVLAGLALERTALRFIPELVETGGGAAAARFFWRTLALRMLLWVPIMALAWIFGDGLEAFFHVPLAHFVRIGVGTALVFSIYNHVRGCATARFATRQVAISTAVGSVVTFTTTAVALNRGHGVAGVLVAAACGLLVASLLLLPAASSRHPARSPGGGLAARRFWAMALPFGGIAILNYVVHSASEVFFLGHFQGPELAGFFHLGFTFAQRLIDFLPLALWEVSMAGFSQIAVREPERLPDAVSAYLTLLYLALAPLSMLGIAFAPSVIELLYGSSMLPAATVSQAYFLMAGYAALGAPIGMIVYAREKTSRAFWAYVVFAIVNMGLDWILIPRYALWGAIIGLGLAKLLAVLLMARIAWGEMPTLRLPWPFLARIAVASAPVLLWLAVSDRWREPWQIAVGMVLALLVLLASFRLFSVVGDREAQLIRRTRLPFGDLALRLLGVPQGRALSS